MPNSVYRLAAACGGALALTALATGVLAQDNSLPEGPAKALVASTCSQCHSTDVITQTRRSPEEWQDIVTRMEGMGATLDADQEKIVVAYLSTNLGPQGSAPAGTTTPVPITAAPAATAPSAAAPPAPDPTPKP
jgi:mono/diheme cytochrome c family protein